MKCLLSLAFTLLFCGLIYAQNKTIILVRHAEKDTSATQNKSDPDLTDSGKQRAERLFALLKPYKPQHIFSTNYKRTRFTVDPLATNLNEKYRMFVEAYNPSDLGKFAEYLMFLNSKVILVAGHSNTTPLLANLLIKQEKYKELPDSEYSKIFIIRFKKNQIIDEVITY